jgi:hypothetical protein
MCAALKDPPTRLLNLPPPPVGAPSEPVKPPGPSSFDTSRLLERLERLRSTAVGNSRHAPEAPSR